MILTVASAKPLFLMTMHLSVSSMKTVVALRVAVERNWTEKVGEVKGDC
jgi:hypothetical protein